MSMNEQDSTNQDSEELASLGKALQDARLAASLTVDEVAEQLNLAVSTIQDIENDLNDLVERKKFPVIYLRGYIANYAKLVGLQTLDSFFEYQQLATQPSRPDSIRSSVKTSSGKKRSKLLWILIILAAIVASTFVIGKELFPAEFANMDIATLLHGESVSVDIAGAGTDTRDQ